MPSEFGGDVGFVDGLLVEFLEALSFEFFALVLGKVGDVFGMGEIFFFSVCGNSLVETREEGEKGGKKRTFVVEFFEVVDLVLVLIVAMVAGAQLVPHMLVKSPYNAQSLNGFPSHTQSQNSARNSVPSIGIVVSPIPSFPRTRPRNIVTKESKPSNRTQPGTLP